MSWNFRKKFWPSLENFKKLIFFVELKILGNYRKTFKRFIFVKDADFLKKKKNYYNFLLKILKYFFENSKKKS